MSTLSLRVWLVDDDASIRWVLERALRNGGMLPRTFDSAEPALTALRADAPDVLITDIRMSGQSGARAAETHPRGAPDAARHCDDRLCGSRQCGVGL